MVSRGGHGESSLAGVRRLLPLASAVVLVDTLLYAALVPLLPSYAAEHGLSKGAAGAFVAAYATGVLLAAIPAGLAAARLGPKPTVLAGLALMSLASVGFGLAGDVWALGFARLAQGLGSALSWAGSLAWLIAAVPAGRRGEVLGTAIGAAVLGALLGPVVGGAAGLVGTEPVFAAVAALVALLALWALRTPAGPPERAPLAALPRALREPRFLGGLWLMLLPALLFGVLAVLVPLELGALGWGAAAIGALFLASAALEAVLNPVLGRVSDRRGRLLPVRAGLVASIAVSLALAWAADGALLAALVIAAAVSYGAFYAPGLALLSEGAERQGLAQGIAFGVMNAAWAAGNGVGPALGGTLAQLGGDVVPYLLTAALCLATLAATRPRQGRRTGATL